MFFPLPQTTLFTHGKKTHASVTVTVVRENPDRAKNQSDCRIRYRDRLEKNNNKYVYGYMTDHVFELGRKRNALSSIYGRIMNLQNDQFPVGLIVQLIEHCIGIAEVMGSNLVQAGFFFQALNFATA